AKLTSDITPFPREDTDFHLSAPKTDNPVGVSDCYDVSSNDPSDADGMHKLIAFWVLFLTICDINSKEISIEKDSTAHGNAFNYKYIQPIGPYTSDLYPEKTKLHYDSTKGIHSLDNPLVNAFLLSSTLNLKPHSWMANHPSLPPVNPFLALLLSQYGRYIPGYGPGRGIYAYQAANDFHNNKPFGSYKIYEDDE
ncbi:unnamed protein product, partial [Phyllotreta striolata]